MSDEPPRAKPVGRRPGDADETKRAILAAAREHFGAVGFDRATIRMIARSAEVDPALVIHHFTSKRRLFVEAHQLPIDPADLFASIAALPIKERGEALARQHLSLFTQAGSPALSILRAAATNDDAATMMREFLNRTLIENASNIAEGPAPELRVALVGSHLFGLLFGRQLLGVEPLVDADLDALVAAVGPAVQLYLEG